MRWKLAYIFALVWVMFCAPAQLWSYAVTQPTIAWRQTYTYDAMGRRVSRTTYQNEVASTTVYVSAGMQEVAEYTDSSDAAAPSRTYVYGSYVDEPVQVRVYASATTQPASTQTATTQGSTTQPSYTDYYYHTNALYSVIAVTDTAGTVVERYTYDAYGQRTITDAAGTPRVESILGNEISFTGRRLDPLTNQYYFRARYYDAAQGRFISRDPLEYVNGMSLYGGYYVPNAVDPSGLMHAYIFNAGINQISAYSKIVGKAIPPSEDSKSLGVVSGYSGTGPISVEVDGTQVATIATDKEETEITGRTCATSFIWDWNWLKRANGYTPKVTGKIRFVMNGDELSTTYTTDMKYLKQTESKLLYHLVENAGLSGLQMTVSGDYNQFTIGNEVSFVGKNTQCVWLSGLQAYMEWTHSDQYGTYLAISTIESEFGKSMKPKGIDYYSYDRPSMGESSVPTGGTMRRSTSSPTIDTASFIHDTRGVWFVAGQNYWITIKFAATAEKMMPLSGGALGMELKL